VNTDKITLSFAQGPNAGKRMPRVGSIIKHNSFNTAADIFLQQQLLNSISSQLILLQNSPPH
jgi:hypothetical protein